MTNPFRKAAQNLAGQFARELVGVAFDAVTAKIQERGERASFVPDPSQSPPVMPPGSQMARERCSDCGGAVFYVTQFDAFSNEYVMYWCPKPGCVGEIRRCAKQFASNREGVAL